MTTKNYNSQELSSDLILQIKNLIDGNQAVASDVIAKEHEADEFVAYLNVQWRFFGNANRQHVAGNSSADKHFGSDKSAYDRECQSLLDRANHDTVLRNSFLQRVVDLDGQALIEVNRPYTFHDFGSLSVLETCSSCRGNGEVTCGSCSGNGKNRCGSCGGAGRQSRQEAQYRNGQYSGNKTIYHSCSCCGGSGKRTCSGCSGRGKVRCSNCGGHGHFTLTCHITAEAKPIYAVEVTTDYDKEILINLLSSSGTKFCAEKIPFHLISDDSDSDATHLFSYEGNSVALEQDFDLKNKNYTCYAFSNPPYPYVKPTIFDDLFADELTYLQTNIPHGSKVAKKKAISFFNRYAGQPVLDEAMRGIAQTRSETSENTGKAVSHACLGFVSDDMANKLAEYLNRVMDKVSPTYASSIWWLIGVITFFYTFFASEDYLENDFSAGGLFFSLLLTASIYLVAAMVAFLLSVIYVMLARRRIPTEYRQKMRHKEPFRRLIFSGIVCFVISSVYGYSAMKNWVPKINALPLTVIGNNWNQQKSNVCKKFEKINWLNPYCQAKPLKVKALSQADKVRSIQKTLVAQGYKVSVDGKFGKQTMSFANKYLKSKNIAIKKVTVDEYYRLIIR